MKTVIYQSFRTVNVPAWITACMDSVKTWAQQHGYDYRFWDDSFFDLVPADLRTRASAHVCLITDYARLVAARQLLDEGYERAVWVDADAFIFNPEGFKLEQTSGYAFCREVWLDRVALGQPQFRVTVNNSVSVFCRDEAIIPFYLDAARRILSSTQPLTPFSIGTDWLLAIRKASPFPLLTSVGILGPEMMYRYLHDDGRFLAPYLRIQTSPVAAVNLCFSKSGQAHHFHGVSEPWTLTEQVVLNLIRKLQSDRGASWNRWYTNGYEPPPDEFSRPVSRYLAVRNELKDLRDTLLGRSAHPW